ncbi:MAG: cell division protein FtsL [Gemmatimonadota bacterium]
MREGAPNVWVVVALVAGLVACSLSLITSQHRARGLFVELERAQQTAQQLEADGNRLRVELGRVSQPANVETAARQLGLRAVDSAHTVFVPAPAGRSEANR